MDSAICPVCAQLLAELERQKDAAIAIHEKIGREYETLSTGDFTQLMIEGSDALLDYKITLLEFTKHRAIHGGAN